MRCPECGHHFRVPEDEQAPGEHDCPYCGYAEPGGEVCANCGITEKEDPLAFDGGTVGPWCVKCADEPGEEDDAA